MKNTKLFCVLMALVMVFSSCAMYETVDENGNRFYKDMRRNIEFSYPVDWHIYGASSSDALVVKPDDDAKYAPEIKIIVAYSEEKNDQEKELEAYITALKEQYNDLKVLSSGKSENSKGREFVYVNYQYTAPDGSKLVGSDSFVSISVLTVSVTALCRADEYEAQKENFELVSDTLTNFTEA